jgi:isoquinoline 1-oxidoreductase subunit alpha
MTVQLKINGQTHDLDVEDDAPLLWVIRDEVGLTGTKFGCGIAGAEITTIEGLSANGHTPVQQAWIEHQVPQCGYCQSGMIMAVSALLKTNPHPTDDELALAITNICRCGTYPRIRNAVRALAEVK